MSKLYPCADREPLLDADLRIEYPATGTLIRSGELKIARGEMAAIVGESGAGKSSVALSILRLLRPDVRLTGHVHYGGRDLLRSTPAELRSIRGREIALLLQNAMAALNPHLRLSTQFREAWRAHAAGADGWRANAEQNLRAVGIDASETFFRRYPRELSTGIAQRALLALVLLHSPKLLIADEPTSALDVITQAEVLSLFRVLNRERGLALLFVTHDLLAAASLCDRIYVMKDGEVVESGSRSEVLESPRHPYTRAMLAALSAKLAAGIAGPKNTTPGSLSETGCRTGS